VKLEPVGGAASPDSPFCARRSSEQEFLEALEHRESIILIRGARQIVRTSMQAQGVRQVRELGWRCGQADDEGSMLSRYGLASGSYYSPLLGIEFANGDQRYPLSESDGARSLSEGGKEARRGVVSSSALRGVPYLICDAGDGSCR
jgi:hypothetical protein